MRRFDPILEADCLATALEARNTLIFQQFTDRESGPRVAKFPPGACPLYMTPTSRDSIVEQAVPEEFLHEPLDSLSIELGRISAEIQSIHSGFQAQMQQTLVLMRKAMEKQYREKFDRAAVELREQLRKTIEDTL